MRSGDVWDGARLDRAGAREDWPGVQSDQLAGQVISASGEQEKVQTGQVVQSVDWGLQSLHDHNLPVPDSGKALRGAEDEDLLHPDHGEDLVRRGEAGHHGPCYCALCLHWSEVGWRALDNLLQPVDPVHLAGEVLAHEVERLLQLADSVD